MPARPALFAATMLPLLVGFASASPLSYEDQVRRTNIYSEFIEAPFDVGFDVEREVGVGPFRSDLAFGLDDDATGRFANGNAFQSSTLARDTISATNRVVSTTRGSGYAGAMSLVFVEFGISRTVDAEMVGEWSFSRSSVAAGVLLEATLTRISNDGEIDATLHEVEIDQSSGLTASQTLTNTFVLEPGRYQLLTTIYSSASFDNNSQVTLDYTLAFTPTPGTLAILCAFGLGGARRRRQADSPT